MSSYNDELLYHAVWDGNLEKVKDLVAKGAGKGYKYKQNFYVSKLIILLQMLS